MMSPDEITALRRRLDLTQAELGRLLAVSRQAVWMWEEGRQRPTPQAERLLKLLARRPELVADLEAIGRG